MRQHSGQKRNLFLFCSNSQHTSTKMYHHDSHLVFRSWCCCIATSARWQTWLRGCAVTDAVMPIVKWCFAKHSETSWNTCKTLWYIVKLCKTSWTTSKTSWNTIKILVKHHETLVIRCDKYWCSMQRHRRSHRVSGDYSVGITLKMCNRVTNHGDMDTFSRPGPSPIGKHQSGHYHFSGDWRAGKKKTTISPRSPFVVVLWKISK